MNRYKVWCVCINNPCRFLITIHLYKSKKGGFIVIVGNNAERYGNDEP